MKDGCGEELPNLSCQDLSASMAEKGQPRAAEEPLIGLFVAIEGGEEMEPEASNSLCAMASILAMASGLASTALSTLKLRNPS